ncbi:MAG: hypothetical protein CSA42_04370 [Gammaproteobacteria bacterium]|nr:MAG: hypothetical protein CSA42_04370 [Gammaproteobacteria bacterium]
MKPLDLLLAVLVAIIWGVNFTFIKWGIESFEPIMMTAMRFFFTAIPLIFVIKRPKFTLTFFIYAIGTFAIQYGLLFYAMHLGASAGLSALILQVQVFITIFLAYLLLGEGINRWQILGLVISVLGLALIGFNLGGDIPAMSFICILLSATGWSFGNIASKKLMDNSPISLVVWGGLVVSVLMMAMSLILEPNAWTIQTFINASVKSWLSLSFIVYISTLAGFGLWVYLLQCNEAAKIMPFALLVPVVGMFASVILTAEAMTWWKVVAMVLIMLGLMVSRKPVKI